MTRMCFRFATGFAMAALLASVCVAPLRAQLASTGNQRWAQESDGILDDFEDNDAFGAAVETGDFNGDGFLDLAVGVPGENDVQGRINVIYGSATGLTSQGNQRWNQGDENVLDDSEDGDAFGSSLTAGDFNGDGFTDLAVGVPGENSDSGRVNVIYGSANGLTSQGNQRWTQGEDGILDDSESNDLFGASVEAGDFNGDGFDDLAIGVPGENDGAGRVNVIHGSATGLTSQGNQRWTQGTDGILDEAEDGDAFGNALAAGDFNRDGFDDLAIGVPGENDNGGRMNVIYGSAAGLASANNQRWNQGDDGILDDLEDGDVFGVVLAAGDFNGDGYDDVAVGAPGENNSNGRVNIIFGSANRLSSANNQRWNQGDDGILDDPESGDLFGDALVAGDFNNDGFDDLGVGVPGENGGSGRVSVIYGSMNGLTSAGNQRWTQGEDGLDGGPEGNDAFGTALAAGDFSGNGPADLAVGTPGEDSASGTVTVIYGNGPANAAIVGVVGAGLSIPSLTNISPNAIVSVFGSNFFDDADGLSLSPDDIADGRVPTVLGGVCVEFDGARAPMFDVFPGQLNVQAPDVSTTEQVDVQVILNCGQPGERRSEFFPVDSFQSSPEFFYFLLSQDGVNPIAAYNETKRELVGEPGLIRGATFEPAAPTNVVTVFMTGLGDTSPSFAAGELPNVAARTVLPVRAQVGETAVDVIYAGVSPGFAGLYQVSFRIPAGLAAGDYPVTVQVGEFADARLTPAGGFLTVGP